MIEQVKNRTYRILIVDDHPLVRCGFSGLISQQPDLEVCGEAPDEAEALKKLDSLEPDLVIVDISLGGTSGLELIKQIKTRENPPKMLVVSMHDEKLFAERCLRAGAMGYVNKAVAPDQIIEAIRQILDEQIYVSQQMANRMLQGMIGGRDPLESSPIQTLSDRELEVFGLIGRGMSTREIAQRLQLSVKTIESYREHIKTKLSLPSSSELMRHAVQWVLENG